MDVRVHFEQISMKSEIVCIRKIMQTSRRLSKPNVDFFYLCSALEGSGKKKRSLTIYKYLLLIPTGMVVVTIIVIRLLIVELQRCPGVSDVVSFHFLQQKRDECKGSHAQRRQAHYNHNCPQCPARYAKFDLFKNRNMHSNVNWISTSLRSRWAVTNIPRQ